MSNRRTVFCNARLIDPASGLDAKGGLLVENGKIADVGARLFGDVDRSDPEVIDCKGLVLAPGLIDMRVFTGEPGSEHRETLESASRAAAAGGVTTMVVMPNTDPVIDEPSLVDFIRRRAQATARVNVAPMAALTRHLAGETMTEMGLLKEAGAVAFTDGDRTVSNTRVLRRALSLCLHLWRAGCRPCGRSRSFPRRLRDRRRICHATGPFLGSRRRRGHDRGARHPPRGADRRALPFRANFLPRLAGGYRRGQAARPAHHLRRRGPSPGAERVGCRPLLHLHEGEAAAALRSRPPRDGRRRRLGRDRCDRLQPRSSSRRYQAPALRTGGIRSHRFGDVVAGRARPVSQRPCKPAACPQSADGDAGRDPGLRYRNAGKRRTRRSRR